MPRSPFKFDEWDKKAYSLVGGFMLNEYEFYSTLTSAMGTVSYDYSQNMKESIRAVAARAAKECRILVGEEYSTYKNDIIEAMIALHGLSNDGRLSVVGTMSVFCHMRKAWEYYQEKASSTNLVEDSHSG